MVQRDGSFRYFYSGGRGGPVTTRAQETEAARQEKSRRLEPEESPKIERVLLQIKEKRLVERITAGVAGFRVASGV